MTTAGILTLATLDGLHAAIVRADDALRASVDGLRATKTDRAALDLITNMVSRETGTMLLQVKSLRAILDLVEARHRACESSEEAARHITQARGVKENGV